MFVLATKKEITESQVRSWEASRQDSYNYNSYYICSPETTENKHHYEHYNTVNSYANLPNNHTIFSYCNEADTAIIQLATSELASYFCKKATIASCSGLEIYKLASQTPQLCKNAAFYANNHVVPYELDDNEMILLVYNKSQSSLYVYSSFDDFANEATDFELADQRVASSFYADNIFTFRFNREDYGVLINKTTLSMNKLSSAFFALKREELADSLARNHSALLTPIHGITDKYNPRNIFVSEIGSNYKFWQFNSKTSQLSVITLNKNFCAKESFYKVFNTPKLKEIKLASPLLSLIVDGIIQKSAEKLLKEFEAKLSQVQIYFADSMKLLNSIEEISAAQRIRDSDLTGTLKKTQSNYQTVLNCIKNCKI